MTGIGNRRVVLTGRCFNDAPDEEPDEVRVVYVTDLRGSYDGRDDGDAGDAEDGGKTPFLAWR